MAELGEQGTAAGAPDAGAPPRVPADPGGPARLDQLGAHWPRAGSPPPVWADEPRRGRTRHRPHPLTSLRRRWRRPALTFQALVVGFGLALAAIVLLVVTLVPERRGVDGDPSPAPGAPRSLSATTSATATPSLPPTTLPPAGYAIGGELLDAGTFADGPATEFRPYAAMSSQDRQVAAALYDGLTDIDPADPEARPRRAVAESWEVDRSARAWRFRLRPGLSFSNGEPVLPSSFRRGWDLAAAPDNESPDAELLRVIRGASGRREGTADHITGVTADDDAMTLDVELVSPLAEFDAFVSHPVFSPVPESAGGSPARGLVGNGPFVRAASGEEGVTVLRRNPWWDGRRYDTALGLPHRPYLDGVRLVTPGAGGAQVLRPSTSGAAGAPPAGWEVTDGQPLLGSYVMAFGLRRPQVSGAANDGLRLAVMHAVDRRRLADEAFAGGAWRLADGLAPPSMPGYQAALCSECTYDPDVARRHFTDWQAAGGTLEGPLQVVHGDTPLERAGGAAIVTDLQAAGIPADDLVLPALWYEAALADGNCDICLQRWVADVPSAESLARALLGEGARNRDGLGGYEYSDVDEHLAVARRTADRRARVAEYREAEAAAMASAQVIPLAWPRHTYAYDPARVAAFPLQPTGLVAWERVALAG